ncbi:hypothetical protein LDL36_03210 [Komagataeibacter sp. FNDCR1]|nr:hypothetical protein [Komagataeibacter sp. FNDCR1]
MNGPDGLFGTTLRQPPTNVEAEQALLGALLTNNGVLSRIEEILEPEHFYTPIYGAVYGAARQMIWNGGRADPITLRPKFEGDLRLRQDETAMQMLVRLAASMVGIAYTAEYATTIRSAWFRRTLFEVCSETADLCCRPGELPDSAVMEGLENRITRIASGNVEVQPTVQIGEAIGEAIANARAAAERGDGLAGITWGYKALDRMTGGLHPDGVDGLHATSMCHDEVGRPFRGDRPDESYHNRPGYRQVCFSSAWHGRKRKMSAQEETRAE